MKEKPLMPTLRENKRYLVYEVMSDESFDAKDVSKTIRDSMKEYVGNKGMAQAGLIFLDNKYNKSHNRGLVRVSHDSINNLKASLLFIEGIKGKKASVRSIYVSGIMDKAEKYLVEVKKLN